MKITCNLAMDLVDVYTNSVAREETVNIVKEHLRECPACRKYYSEYKKELRDNKPVFKAEFSPHLSEELLTSGIERLSKRLRIRRIARYTNLDLGSLTIEAKGDRISAKIPSSISA